MTIAVTGASGFIGKHVLAALTSRTDTPIVAVSRRVPATLPTGVRHVAFDLARADADCFDALGRPDLLVHLAWDGLPNYRSLHHLEEELPRQYAFLRHMVAGGLPAMTVTGTCYEYGMVDGCLSENAIPFPANAYAEAKNALRRQLDYLKEQHPFALCWARLFYTWGEDQAVSSLYPLLRAAVARGDERFAMSAGEQLRDFLPVQTLAGMIADLALRRADDGIVNLCSGVPVSVRTLVERWIADHDWRIEPERGVYPYPTHEPLAFWGDASKRRSLIGGA